MQGMLTAFKTLTFIAIKQFKIEQNGNELSSK